MEAAVNEQAEQRLLLLSGLSGSGKTIVLHALEDQGYYCVDNLPLEFLGNFARQVASGEKQLYRRVAVSIDARNPVEKLARFPDILRDIKSSRLQAELLFLEASEDILIKRFSETRRRHPLSNETLSLREAIRTERELLRPVAAEADLYIDTSTCNVRDLRDLVRERVVARGAWQLSLQLLSFGFKHGLPPDADFVFDVRCLPNPHWDPTLRDYTGQDDCVVEFLRGAPAVGEMIEDIFNFANRWIGAFESENRSYLTLAVGCTGGRHRSVFSVESLAGKFLAGDRSALVRHRDLR